MFLFSVWSSVSLVSVSLLHVLFSCLAFSLLIMCEATREQLKSELLHTMVETLYGTQITTVVNACGKDAEFETYTGNPRAVALSPYHVGSRDRKTDEAVDCAKESWSRDEMTAFHCNQSFHRGVNIWVVTIVEVFGCGPQNRMSIV